MKKIIACLFLVLLFSTSFSYASTILYQRESENKISSGTILKNYNLFTEDGWLDINILEVDLKDKYTKIGLLTSSEGSGKLKNVLSMAKEATAIAAINGDFFAGNNGKGHSIGLAIRNSDIISSTALENNEKNTFSSFLMTEENDIFFEYITHEIILTSKKTKEEIMIPIINKYADNYAYPAIYTNDWGKFSIGSSDTLVLTEAVIKNNKVIEIRYNEPAVEIPENGFVISALGEGAEWINTNLKKGTKIDLDITFSPDIVDIEFAISGGAKLLEEGLIPSSFSHDISGRNPRTALGISEDNETLYLITVDGRSTKSIGMTQLELAEFLKSIDIYNAINLDGGGSTTMVAQNIPNSEITSLQTVNHPSGGSLRSVVNALGVFSTAPDSDKLYGLNLYVEDTNIFKGEERTITVTGYNKYYNPIEIDFEDIKWDYNGVKVEVKENKIFGNTVGATTLTASIGKIEAEIELNILSDANELFISPKKETITPGESINYTIQAKNKNGYYAKTNNETITSKIIEYYYENEKQDFIPEDAKIENHKFTAKTSGEYILAFSKGSITSYALVSISSQKENLLDDFETNTFTFDEYPDEVLGNASLSSENVYSGKTSVKLEYDFKQDIQIRGAYIELKKPYIIPENATSLSFWVYNNSKKSEKLKIKLKDAKNNVKLIVLEDSLTHDGWKEINYDLSNISLPATLSDIYLAQDNISIQDTGYIYVDHLIYYSNQTAKDSQIRLPKDIKLEDTNNSIIENENTSTFKIALIDTIKEPTLMIDSLKNRNLIHSINQNADLAIITNETSEKLLNQITIDKMTQTGYDLTHIKKATFIHLDISNSGLRKTDSTQWTNLSLDIQDSEHENVFLILNGSIDDFSDLEERKLFVDILCELKRKTKKNITVLHTGYYTDYSMERGVKFLGINTQHISPEKLAQELSYILITVNDNQIAYEFKKIF